LLQNVAQDFAAADPKNREQNADGDALTAGRFEELFLGHYACIVGILRRIVGDHGTAEDLANEVFLKLYRRPKIDYVTGNVPGWLYRTAVNLGIDALRASARRNRYEQAAARAELKSQSQEDALQHVLRSERQQRVRAVLAQLKPVQAQALLLRASGHSYKELAESLGAEPGSIGTLLIRAEAAFERRYQELHGRQEDV